jgi:pimeloyl-ACP methyl ester carboxylesterase
MRTRRPRLRWLAAVGVLAGALAGGASDALATGAPLAWEDCGDGFECATVTVPRDYDEPGGRTFTLPVIRLPAQDASQRIGTLFVNFGGPGPSGVEALRFGGPVPEALHRRFDIVAWDSRGTAGSRPAVNCGPDPEFTGPPLVPGDTASERALVADARAYAARCASRNGSFVDHVTTGDTARDLDRLRALVGDPKLTYLGISYGTAIGSSYATLFPGRVRALALDGAFDLEGAAERPIRAGREFVAGHERALGRFLQTCAAHQEVCLFGGDDPWAALDELLVRLDREPVPAPGAPEPIPVTGDDVRGLLLGLLPHKDAWPIIGPALAQAAAGDGTGVREIIGGGGSELPDGSNPTRDANTASLAADAHWPKDPETYISAGRHAFGMFDHFWAISGYFDLYYGLFPVDAEDGFYGPVENSRKATTVLVVGTVYDPATPYAMARRLTADLGNARLLTMRGDGHAAYRRGSPDCIDPAVEAYLTDLVLPPPGTVCRQEIPFQPPLEPPAQRAAAGALPALPTRPVPPPLLR